MSARSTLHTAAIAAAIALTPAGALAQSSATSAAAAEKLFQQGRALMTEGRHAEACPKLAESLRLDPAVGTSLNLAECYERVDKIASAWVTYRKAETMARRAGQRERFTHAAARAAALESKLSYVTIMPLTRAKGLTITRDGEEIGEAAWRTPVPIDGGAHVIQASAPGRRPWELHVEVRPSSDEVNVEIPELEVEPVSATAPPRGGSAMTATSSVQRTIGWATLATGVAALGTGLAFGAVAMTRNDDASAHCSAVDCDERGVALTRDAKSAAAVSTVLVAAGGALAAGGIVLVLTSPRRHTTERAGVSLSPGAFGVWATF